MLIRSTSALVGAFIVALGGIVASEQTPRLTPDEARRHVGETATVCGVVAVARCDAGRTLLDLRTLTGSGTVSVAVSQNDAAAFGDRLASRHDRREVCATGAIERLGPDTRILVTTPDRLRIEREPPAGASDLDEAFTSCDAGVSLPRAIREVHPRYTPEALNARISGSVLVQAVVGADGVVRNPRVIAGLDRGLDEEALRAVGQWRFSPGLRNDQPVPVTVVVEMTFSMK